MLATLDEFDAAPANVKACELVCLVSCLTAASRFSILSNELAVYKGAKHIRFKYAVC